MSTLTADPGFARGQVLGITKTYYDAQVGDGSHLLGVAKVFLDTDPQTQKLNTNVTVECVAVKNKSGAALLPGTVVQFSAGAVLTEIDTAATQASVRVGVVDEYLPPAGVPADEVFWVVVNGPTRATKTTGAVSAGAEVTVSTTAGKVAAGSTRKVGVCITAAASGDSSVRILAG